MNVVAGRCIGLNVLHKSTGSKKRQPLNNNSISSNNYEDTKRGIRGGQNRIFQTEKYLLAQIRSDNGKIINSKI